MNATFQALAFAASKTEVWTRFALLIHSFPTELNVAALLDSAAGIQCTLAYNPSDGLLRLYRGPVPSNLLATSTTAFIADTWHVIEWRTLISTATTGTSEVWLDGTRVINFSGDNSNTAVLNVQTLQLGQISNGIGSATGLYIAYDDIAVNDTAGSVNNGRIGEGRVVLLTPNGAGSNTGLSRGGTDTGTNYSQTNELPPSMAQFVYSSGVGVRDTYALTNLPANIQAINVAEVITLSQNSEAGPGSLGLTVKSGATTNEGTAQPLTMTPAYLRQQYETDPNTTAAWTPAAVNALEAGVTVR